jgi:hypothetical protein
MVVWFMFAPTGIDEATSVQRTDELNIVFTQRDHLYRWMSNLLFVIVPVKTALIAVTISIEMYQTGF